MDTVILFEKSKTLNELAEEITTYEQALGPVVALGRTDEASAATFKLGRHPKDELKIALVMPPSATKVCDGKVWNANVRVDAVAYRMPA
jgi:hypothetical protein